MALVDRGEFRKLFVEELGWNRPDLAAVPVEIDGVTYAIEQIAGYSGIRVWLCSQVPDARTQRLIDHKLRKISEERLVIFADAARQEWRWLQSPDANGAGQPRLALHRHYVGTSDESLQQRLGTIEIGLDESPTLIDILHRMRAAFDADVVTKKFFDQFVRQQRALASAIEGIEDDADRDWYSALVMNRLMFIYFMQKKSFLDNNTDYLRSRLNTLIDSGQRERYYEGFLIPLFHFGLGADGHVFDDAATRDLIGDVKYINGGIFSPHELELGNTIAIPDHVFASIFDLFDRFQWRLDDRPTAAQNEINPDVLGFIFEQFVNAKDSQDSRGSDKGAYYTKEDVTHFMASSTIVPVFLERLIARTGVDPWAYLRESPERYIWASLGWGIDLELPSEIQEQAGQLHRPLWDHLADEAFGLPGETWWEVDKRRTEHKTVMQRASSGGIVNVDDAVTENIDLEELAVDTIDRLGSPEHAMEAWRILTELSIIDPTCGSGAFLFAALKILEPLYHATLEVLRQQLRTGEFPAGKTLLESVSQHANEDYFVLKHATLSNLYGVDIMREAVEIARLRLFLKLVSAIEDREDLEPLPDLDFNIKAGNTLVGALDQESLERDVPSLLFGEQIAQVRTSAERISAVAQQFRDAQESGKSGSSAALRADLVNLLGSVRDDVNELYHAASDVRMDITEWVEAQSPFHWFVEFPEVFAQGGFDVVIGNPPYVNRSELAYTVRGFQTDSIDDIYAPCCERAAQITRSDGRLSLIVPIRSQFGVRDAPLRKFYEDRFTNLWISTFQERPAALFQVKVRSTIITGAGTGRAQNLHTTITHSWVEPFRPHLLATLRYSRRPDNTKTPNWMRSSSSEMFGLMDALLSRGQLERGAVGLSEYSVGFKKTATYYLTTYIDPPVTYDAKTHAQYPLNEARLHFVNRSDQLAASAVMASRLAFLWWTFTGDCFNVTKGTVGTIPFSIRDCKPDTFAALVKLGERIEAALPDARSWDSNSGKYVGGYAIPEMKDITDEADELILGDLGRLDALPEIQYAHARMFKSTGVSATTLRALPF